MQQPTSSISSPNNGPFQAAIYSVKIPHITNSKRNNYISTTKYNAFSFLPLALALQFRRYANVYFLICAILQSIPVISPLNPFSAIAPLVFVLSLSIAREGFEDWKRWKSDQISNATLCQVWKDGIWKQTLWKDVVLGNLVKVKSDETVPADILILLSSDPSGIVYLQTSSFDGEKNLKPRMAIPQYQLFPFSSSKDSVIEQSASMNLFSMTSTSIECTPPNPHIQDFSGSLKTDLFTQPITLHRRNLLQRGCRVRNTSWCIGLSVYLGQETKIMMNGCSVRAKTSNIENKINRIILFIMGLEVLCCLISALFCYFSCLKSLAFERVLLQKAPNCGQLAVISFFSYFILYSTFIPISLIVSLEFVKMFQGYFMSTDREMYCALNDRHTECHTVSINQELGQIHYILTDKTGTLTCNRMEFKCLVVGGKQYGVSELKNPEQIKMTFEQFDFSRLSKRYQNVVVPKNGPTYSPQVIKGEAASSKKLTLMLTMMAVCHECIKNPNTGEIQGPSPDEVALLKAACLAGFQFQGTQNKVTKIRFGTKQISFRILRVIEFDSDRKRMTVIVQRSDDTENIQLFTKGADNIIERYIVNNFAPSQMSYLKEQTNRMTVTGLRSLWYAHRSIPARSVEELQKLSPEELERDLELVGATGIEDKLQDYVPETIHALRAGGIKFVMLTGDKLETAENIARACSMIQKGFLVRNQHQLIECRKVVSDLVKLEQKDNIPSPIIDGSTVSLVQGEGILLQLLDCCKSVVFCRVTPKQKAEVVALVKRLGKLTLAIGDGANDVNMITQADVGVGIFGEEGTRAAQVSNYAIGQFCLLWKLLLYYGRLNYIRISEMILYFFYKNLTFTIVQFVYSFYTLGSGQSFWLSWSITLYNMVFTCFPVIIRAIFEVDLEIASGKQALKQATQGRHVQQTVYSYYPKMYKITQANLLFTPSKFVAWFVVGAFQGITCLLMTLYSLTTSDQSSGFQSYQCGLLMAELCAYTSVVVVVTMKLAINVKQWNTILLAGFLIPSIGAYVLFIFALNTIPNVETTGVATNLLSMPTFYLTLFLTVLVMFSVDVGLFAIDATKINFSNYLKFKTLGKGQLTETYLDKYAIEMEEKITAKKT